MKSLASTSSLLRTMPSIGKNQIVSFLQKRVHKNIAKNTINIPTIQIIRQETEPVLIAKQPEPTTSVEETINLPAKKTTDNKSTSTMNAEDQTRVEHDSFGDIEVPAKKYYGANTARSLIHFNIGGPSERMPVFK